MKGIVEQIKERTNVTPEPISLKVLIEYCEKAAKIEAEQRRTREQQYKENYKQLIQRSKELNKPIPGYVELVCCTGTITVGTDFLTKYKEWL